MTQDDVDDDDADEHGDDDDVCVEILCWLQIWFWEAAENQIQPLTHWMITIVINLNLNQTFEI